MRGEEDALAYLSTRSRRRCVLVGDRPPFGQKVGPTAKSRSCPFEREDLLVEMEYRDATARREKSRVPNRPGEPAGNRAQHTAGLPVSVGVNLADESPAIVVNSVLIGWRSPPFSGNCT